MEKNIKDFTRKLRNLDKFFGEPWIRYTWLISGLKQIQLLSSSKPKQYFGICNEIFTKTKLLRGKF